MTIRDLVRDYVLADSDISALIGDRMRRRLRQKEAYPAVQIMKVDIVRPNHLRGPASLATARIQFDVWCDANGAANIGMSGSEVVVAHIGALIRQRLDGRAISMVDDSVSPPVTVDAWPIFDVETEGEADEPNGGLSLDSADYLVNYQTSGGSY